MHMHTVSSVLYRNGSSNPSLTEQWHHLQKHSWDKDHSSLLSYWRWGATVPVPDTGQQLRWKNRRSCAHSKCSFLWEAPSFPNQNSYLWGWMHFHGFLLPQKFWHAKHPAAVSWIIHHKSCAAFFVPGDLICFPLGHVKWKNKQLLAVPLLYITQDLRGPSHIILSQFRMRTEESLEYFPGQKHGAAFTRVPFHMRATPVLHEINNCSSRYQIIQS